MRAELERNIAHLESCLDDEKNYNRRIFVKEQISQMSQRAYLSTQLA